MEDTDQELHEIPRIQRQFRAHSTLEKSQQLPAYFQMTQQPSIPLSRLETFNKETRDKNMQTHLERMKKKELAKRRRQQEKDVASSQESSGGFSSGNSENEQRRQSRMFKKFNQLMSFKLGDNSRSMTQQNETISQKNMRLNMIKFQQNNSSMRRMTLSKRSSSQMVNESLQDTSKIKRIEGKHQNKVRFSLDGSKQGDTNLQTEN